MCDWGCGRGRCDGAALRTAARCATPGGFPHAAGSRKGNCRLPKHLAGSAILPWSLGSAPASGGDGRPLGLRPDRLKPLRSAWGRGGRPLWPRRSSPCCWQRRRRSRRGRSLERRCRSVGAGRAPHTALLPAQSMCSPARAGLTPGCSRPPRPRAAADAGLRAIRDAITNWPQFSAANNLSGWGADPAIPPCLYTGVTCDADGRLSSV